MRIKITREKGFVSKNQFSPSSKMCMVTKSKDRTMLEQSVGVLLRTKKTRRNTLIKACRILSKESD